VARRAAAVSGGAARAAAAYGRGDFAAVAAAVATLGPTFIKFGQALASRPDLVGAQLADALTVLQVRGHGVCPSGWSGVAAVSVLSDAGEGVLRPRV
jgi:predicted unusual protein kinase regulating ubiquinone biosynthesis (AarF/ABC1/UbiB family)